MRIDNPVWLTHCLAQGPSKRDGKVIMMRAWVDVVCESTTKKYVMSAGDWRKHDQDEAMRTRLGVPILSDGAAQPSLPLLLAESTSW